MADERKEKSATAVKTAADIISAPERDNGVLVTAKGARHSEREASRVDDSGVDKNVKATRGRDKGDGYTSPVPGSRNPFAGDEKGEEGRGKNAASTGNVTTKHDAKCGQPAAAVPRIAPDSPEGHETLTEIAMPSTSAVMGASPSKDKPSEADPQTPPQSYPEMRKVPQQVPSAVSVAAAVADDAPAPETATAATATAVPASPIPSIAKRGHSRSKKAWPANSVLAVFEAAAEAIEHAGGVSTPPRPTTAKGAYSCPFPLGEGPSTVRGRGKTAVAAEADAKIGGARIDVVAVRPEAVDAASTYRQDLQQQQQHQPSRVNQEPAATRPTSAVAGKTVFYEKEGEDKGLGPGLGKACSMELDERRAEGAFVRSVGIEGKSRGKKSGRVAGTGTTTTAAAAAEARRASSSPSRYGPSMEKRRVVARSTTPAAIPGKGMEENDTPGPLEKAASSTAGVDAPPNSVAGYQRQEELGETRHLSEEATSTASTVTAADERCNGHSKSESREAASPFVLGAGLQGGDRGGKSPGIVKEACASATLEGGGPTVASVKRGDGRHRRNTVRYRGKMYVRAGTYVLSIPVC